MKMQRIRWWVLILIGTVSTVSLPALDFEADLGFAPRLDGTFNAFAGGTLRYTPAFYSSLYLEYETESEEESEREGNLTNTLSTDSTSFSIDFDVLGYNVLKGPIDLGFAASVEYIRFGAEEELLYDADDGFVIPATGTNTLLLTNDRTLNVLLPTIDTKFRAELWPVRIDLGGEYSPMVFVSLDQEANTDPVYPGFTDDGPVSTSGDYQSGQSFSVNGSLLFNLPFVAPSIAAEYTHLPIEYDIATVGGVQTIDTLIRELSFDATVAVKVLGLLGFSPTLSVRYDRAWTEIDGVDDVETSDEWLVFIGVARY